MKECKAAAVPQRRLKDTVERAAREEGNLRLALRVHILPLLLPLLLLHLLLHPLLLASVQPVQTGGLPYSHK